MCRYDPGPPARAQTTRTRSRVLNRPREAPTSRASAPAAAAPSPRMLARVVSEARVARVVSLLAGKPPQCGVFPARGWGFPRAPSPSRAFAASPSRAATSAVWPPRLVELPSAPWSALDGAHDAFSSKSSSSAVALGAEDAAKRPPPPPPPANADNADAPRYHFEFHGAEAKRAASPDKIKCMCHEVAAAAALRVNALKAAEKAGKRGVVSDHAVLHSPFDPNARAKDKQATADDIDNPNIADDFCVFTHTVMRDILEAKHNKLSFWGATHFCDVNDVILKAVRQMTDADVGALLVMDNSALDADGNEVITESELRAAPRVGALKGIVTERDYLRAVARGRVKEDTTVREVMTDFDEEPNALVSVTPDTSVLAAMEIMTEQRIRCVVGVDGFWFFFCFFLVFFLAPTYVVTVLTRAFLFRTPTRSCLQAHPVPVHGRRARRAHGGHGHDRGRRQGAPQRRTRRGANLQRLHRGDVRLNESKRNETVS